MVEKMQALKLAPISGVNGCIRLPGSKSLSNRVLLLSALAKGETLISNLLESDDTAVLIQALTQLGIATEKRGSLELAVRGDKSAFQGHALRAPLYLGNAGTAMRPMTAILAFCAQRLIELTGDQRMQERPIGSLVASLNQLGCHVADGPNPGCPPLFISPMSPSDFRPRSTILDASQSSQFVSAMLMAAPTAPMPIHLHLAPGVVSWPYIEMTTKLMARFGVAVECAGGGSFSLSPQTYQSPGQILVEGDASGASYFWAAAAIKGLAPVRVYGITRHSLQGDVRFADVLAMMGAKVSYGPDYTEVQRGASLRGVDLDLNDIPDAAMTLATTALFAEGRTRIRNIANWRIKETDRLKAMASELRKVGAEVEEGADYIAIDPPRVWRHAEIETYHDHRMAMCFALCALGPSGVTILDPGCTSKTYPKYFDDFARISVGP